MALYLLLLTCCVLEPQTESTEEPNSTESSENIVEVTSISKFKKI